MHAARSGSICGFANIPFSSHMTAEILLTILVLVAGFGYLVFRRQRILAWFGRSGKETATAASDRREAVKRRIAKANDHELTKYLSQGFGLPQDDPWIASVVKARKLKGLDAAVSMVVDLEAELRNKAK